MLVVPPRSQQLKLSITYDQWTMIQTALMAAGKPRHQALATEIQLIRDALLQEGHP